MHETERRVRRGRFPVIMTISSAALAGGLERPREDVAVVVVVGLAACGRRAAWSTAARTRRRCCSCGQSSRARGWTARTTRSIPRDHVDHGRRARGRAPGVSGTYVAPARGKRASGRWRRRLGDDVAAAARVVVHEAGRRVRRGRFPVIMTISVTAPAGVLWAVVADVRRSSVRLTTTTMKLPCARHQPGYGTCCCF